MTETSILIVNLIKEQVKIFFKEKEEIGIFSIEYINISAINGLPDSVLKICSGNEFKISAKGHIAAKQDDNHLRNEGLYLSDMRIKYDSESEKLQVLDCGKIVSPLDNWQLPFPL